PASATCTRTSRCSCSSTRSGSPTRTGARASAVAWWTFCSRAASASAAPRRGWLPRLATLPPGPSTRRRAGSRTRSARSSTRTSWARRASRRRYERGRSPPPRSPACPGPVVSDEPPDHLRDQGGRQGLVERELDSDARDLVLGELGDRRLHRLGDRVEGHVPLPAGVVDEVLPVEPESGHVVADGLGRPLGRCLPDGPPDGLEELPHVLGERADVVLYGPLLLRRHVGRDASTERPRP